MRSKPEIIHLTWDSKLFGYKVGVISLVGSSPQEELEAIIRLGKADDYKLIYIKNSYIFHHVNCSTGNIHLFLADEKITYSRSVETIQNEVIPSFIRLYNHTKPNEELISLALQSGLHSRYAVDSNFKNKEFEKLYRIWIEKSVAKEIAKEVWVSQNQDHKITGFITLALKEDLVDIGLLAVDVNERGKSLGKKLIQTALVKASNWGKQKIQVVTQQRNNTACKFYEKCGFAPEKAEYIYHLWL
jgi:dTDP-4-amino-4,6-dideoxy-D-galactose acyltransferase